MSEQLRDQSLAATRRPFEEWYSDVRRFLELRQRFNDGDYELREWRPMSNEMDRLGEVLGVDDV